MQNELEESIIDATMANDLEGIKNAIQLGIDINHQDFFGKTALHYIESVEAAQLLIDHGADPNIADYNNRPPLFDVNDPELAIFLVDHGADAKFQDKDGLTAMYIWVDFPKVVQRLLVEGADPNIQLVTGSMIIKRGNTALHKVGNLESAQLLVKHGANATIRNIEKQPPFIRPPEKFNVILKPYMKSSVYFQLTFKQNPASPYLTLRIPDWPEIPPFIINSP
ncbi:MAG: hypothetical protein IPN81_01955 [Nitrosomonadales bacterium]|nr:hypothetical protein [Nitrosomonadales bacterium]